MRFMFSIVKSPRILVSVRNIDYQITPPPTKKKASGVYLMPSVSCSIFSKINKQNLLTSK